MGREAEIVAGAKAGDRVVGWKLDIGQRAGLIERFPPKFERTIADHVTLKPRVAAGTPLPDAKTGRIVARADDGRGVEAMAVEIDGSSDRPGGGTYHVTWSLGPNRKARESNDVLARETWQRLPEPVELRLIPALFQ